MIRSSTLLMCALFASAAELKLPPGNHFLAGEALRFPVQAPIGTPWTAWSRTGIWGRSGSVTSANQLELPELPWGCYTMRVGDAAPVSFAVGPQPASGTATERRGVFAIIPNDPSFGAKPAPAGYAEQCQRMAEHLRRLGAGWVRYNFWEPSYGAITVVSEDPATVTVEPYGAAIGLDACHAAGLKIMAEITCVPTALASTAAGAVSHEGASTGNRMPPRSWPLWESFVRSLVQRFSGKVAAWEIWNEPDARDFWLGTPEQFAELAERTARVIRATDPAAQVVAAGFTSEGAAFWDAVLTARPALVQLLDVITTHEDDSGPLRAVMLRHGLGDKPLWHTESKPEPVRFDLAAQGVEREFHFFHRDFAQKYEQFRALAGYGYETSPAGLRWAIQGALVGALQQTKHQVEQRTEITHFRSATGGAALAWRPQQSQDAPGSLRLRVKAESGSSLRMTREDGQHTIAKPAADGTFMVPVDGLHFLTGAASIEVLSITAPQPAAAPKEYRFGVDTAVAIGPWKKTATNDPRRLPQVLNLFTHEPPGPDGYRIEQQVEVPTAGTYRLYVITNASLHSSGPQRWVSPWAWRMDDGRTRVVDGPLPALWRWSGSGGFAMVANEPVPAGAYAFTGGSELLQDLGSITLTPGKHVFRFELTAGRLQPDHAWNLQPYEGVVLRPEAVAQALYSTPRALPLSEKPPAGVTVPLPGGSFEEANQLALPAGWQRIQTVGVSTGITYIGTGYEHRAGTKALFLSAQPHSPTTIMTSLPFGRISAALGRDLRAGDTLVLSAWSRHYWEEGASQPAAVTFGFSTHADRQAVRDPIRFQRDEPSRTYAQMTGRWTLTAADLTRVADLRVFIETVGGAAMGAALWDGVTLQVEPLR